MPRAPPRGRSPAREPDETPRAQTPQDFAIGVSIFLLTMAFVFTFIPGIFSPFATDPTPGSEQIADRVAEDLVANYSIEGRPNWLNESFRAEILETGLSKDEETRRLQDRVGIPTINNVNITIRQAVDRNDDNETEVIARVGEPFQEQSTVAVSRLVVIAKVPECAPSNVGVDGISDFENRGSPLSGSPPVPTSRLNGNACRMIVRVW